VIEGNYAEDEEESQSEESYHTPLRDLGHIVFRRLKVLHDEDDAVSDANLRVFLSAYILGHCWQEENHTTSQRVTCPIPSTVEVRK
jgi:DNA-directed RNA polymerase specialized sigma24 family protein